MGLGSMINVRMVIPYQWSKNELLTINFKAIGLLEGKNPNNTVHMRVPRLESTRGPRKNGDGEKYHYSKNFLRGGAILTTFLPSPNINLFVFCVIP